MKQLRRFIWFIASRLLALLFVLGLITCVFYYAMNASNAYVLLKDGMAKRAQVIMQGENNDLRLYFSDACLERDVALRAENRYQTYYSITGFDHRLDMNYFWCWPWEDTARATVTESVPAIDGKLKSALREEALSLNLPAVPKWQSVRYSVILSREMGQWRIKSLTAEMIPD